MSGLKQPLCAGWSGRSGWLSPLFTSSPCSCRHHHIHHILGNRQLLHDSHAPPPLPKRKKKVVGKEDSYKFIAIDDGATEAVQLWQNDSLSLPWVRLFQIWGAEVWEGAKAMGFASSTQIIKGRYLSLLLVLCRVIVRCFCYAFVFKARSVKYVRTVLQCPVNKAR